MAFDSDAAHIGAMEAAAPPVLFDRAVLRRRLERAVRTGPADFLLARAADDLADRVAAVRRPFRAALDLGTPGPHAAVVLASRPETHTLVRAAGVPATFGDGPWQRLVGDEEALAFRPACFDLVVSLLALQTLNDLPGCLAQIRRVLVSDGLFLGCLVGGRSLWELRAAWTEAEADITGGVSPRVAPFADVRDMGGLLQRAGFALPVTDSETLTLRYDTMFDLVRDLRAMGATNALAARRRRFTPRSVAVRAAALYAERYAQADGRVTATVELIWLSGWAPHESQQKPLQPGSARMRLADALKTRPLPEDGA